MTANKHPLSTFIKLGLKLGSKVREISIDSCLQKLQREKKRCVETIDNAGRNVQGGREAWGMGELQGGGAHLNLRSQAPKQGNA